MSARHTSFGKVERERAKKNKAAAKREVRQARPGMEEDGDEQPVPVVVEPPDHEATAELLARIEELHQRFDAKLIDYEDFETQKNDLMGRLRLD